MMISRPLRKFFWLMQSFFLRHKAIITAAAGGGILVFLGFKNLLPLFASLIKPTVRIGIIGNYRWSNLPASVTQKISRGLTKINSDGQPQPDILDHWEINDSGTIYRLYLQPDIFWTNGTPVTAWDIHLDLTGVNLQIVDNLTLELQLAEPYAPLLAVLSRPLFKDNQFGAGDFRIKSVRYHLDYLQALDLTGNKKNLSYRFYPSLANAWLGFRLGEVDRLENLPTNPLTDRWQKRINLTSQINNQAYTALIFNQNHPLLADKTLRQALAYGLEQKSASPQNRALSPISPDSWAYNPKVKTYEFSPQQAKEMFAKFSQEATVSGRLELTLGTSEAFLNQAEKIAASWESVLDIQTNVKVVSAIEPDWQILLIYQEIPDDPDQHALWHSTQDTNISHYSDLKIDKLLEDGRRTLDMSKRKEIYQDFQRFLAEDLPAIFLEHPVVYNISRRP